MGQLTPRLFSALFDASPSMWSTTMYFANFKPQNLHWLRWSSKVVARKVFQAFDYSGSDLFPHVLVTLKRRPLPIFSCMNALLYSFSSSVTNTLVGVFDSIDLRIYYYNKNHFTF